MKASGSDHSAEIKVHNTDGDTLRINVGDKQWWFPDQFEAMTLIRALHRRGTAQWGHQFHYDLLRYINGVTVIGYGDGVE